MTTILVDGVVTEIKTAPITMLMHRGDVHLMPDGQVEIGPEQTLARAAALTADEWTFLKGHPAFDGLFRIVFPDLAYPDKLHQAGSGVRHITGMIVMIIELKEGQTPYIRYPESFLHPSSQCRLADLFIHLSKGAA